MIADYQELIAEVVERTGDANIPMRAAMYTGMAEAALSKRLRVADAEATADITTDADGIAPLPVDYAQLRTINAGTDRLAAYPLSEIQRNTAWGYAIQGRDLVTSFPDTDITLSYYAKLPSLETYGTNWLLDSEPEIYLYAVMRQVFLAKLDAEKAQLASSYLDSLLSKFEAQDHTERFLGTIYRVKGPTP